MSADHLSIEQRLMLVQWRRVAFELRDQIFSRSDYLVVSDLWSVVSNPLVVREFYSASSGQ